MTAILTACALLTACGGSGGDKGVTIAESAQPDSLDPAMGYTINALEPGWLVYTPLLTYRHAAGRAGSQLVPGLAESLPQVSANGRTYRLKLRSGLEYSDGTPVRASDFEHAVERVLALASPGSSFFLGVDGAEQYVAKKRHGGGLRGIVTDDRSGAITIRLLQPDGTFSNVLAMLFGAPVPSTTPFSNRTASPPPGVGPYRYSKVRPGRDFMLERNDRFDVPGIPHARLSPVTVKIAKNVQRQAEDVLHGDLDYMQDPPPPDLLPRIRKEAQGRYGEYPSAASVFLFLNHRTPPFDDPRVRQAAEYALDRGAAERLFGGLLAPACNILPPDVPGSRPVEPCPWEGGGAAKARALVRAAGARGAKVSVWSPKEPPYDRFATVYADSLRKVGLDARPKILDFSQYVQLLGSQRTRAQTGIVTYSQDFPHPADFLRQFSGSTIAPTGSINFGNVDDPELTAAIDKLGRSSDLAGTAGRWAEVDRKLVARAHVVPIGFLKRTLFVSERLKFSCIVASPVYGTDYTSFCRP
ncbi:MAG: peptide/nickel transport system substrate-binding protein [Thermoleophilaceae bacterium]|nr:peptide/nickel transport system substrate-binding protein [Thermoleophilaceae bacterium]